MPKKFAVFDIDGTLIRWQLYHAAAERMAKQGLLGEGAYDAIQQARAVWKKREHKEAFRAYELEVIKAYMSALPKLSVADFNKIVDEIAHEYKEQTYRYTRDLVKKLKADGYLLLAISGSHQELVEHVGQQYGFDDCVGTQYLQKDGYFTGEEVFVAGDKQKALNELIAKHDLSLKGSYAVGDSKSDASMLAIVEHPIAFNPDQALFDIATKEGWQIVIERKNVVYKLDQSDGKYQLQ